MRKFPDILEDTIEEACKWIREVTRASADAEGDYDKSVRESEEAVSLTADVSGTLPVANGGTGAATHTAKSVLIGQGTSAFTSVAPGTSGNVLKSDGTNWTSAAGIVASGFTVGQVVIATLLTTLSTTSTSMTNVTGLQVSITPTSTSSTILLIANGAAGNSTSTVNQMLQIANGSTAILAADTPGNRQPGMVGVAGLTANDLGNWSIICRDSPASTSQQTYNVMHSVDTGTGYINRSGADTDTSSFQRGTSILMAIELRPIT